MSVRQAILLSLACAVSFTACKNESADKNAEITRSMIGTWTSKKPVYSGIVNEEVILDSEHQFKEIVRVYNQAGTLADSYTFAGEWYFDGVNFKRKITSQNGKALPSSQYSYITLEMIDRKPNSFVGRDNIDGVSVGYIKK